MLTAAGADRILTMDLHAAQIQGFFDIPLDHLLGNVTFVEYFMNKFPESEYNHEDFVVVSPDVGSVGRARNFAAKVHMGLAIVDKRRPKANVSEVMNIIGDVRGKTCILYDDLVDTAGSLCNAAKALVEIGGAKEIYACATHGVLSGPAYDRIEASPIKEMVLLNTIPEVANTPSHKIKFLDVAPRVCPCHRPYPRRHLHRRPVLSRVFQTKQRQLADRRAGQSRTGIREDPA